MDVSRSEAQRAQTNVIARSDNRATTMECDDNRNRRGSGEGRGDGCERKNGAQRSFGANVIARGDDLRQRGTQKVVSAYI
jgi:hypothetical protein